MARLQGLLQANKMQAETIDGLRARVADLEAALEPVLRGWHVSGDHGGRLPDCKVPLCQQARAALPDTGEGWLPPDRWCEAQVAINVEQVQDTYPSRVGDCPKCAYRGPVNDSGNIFRHHRLAALEVK